jgi:Ca2+-binding EF-hand superfamily protein
MKAAFGALALVCVIGFAAPAWAQRANMAAMLEAMDGNGDGSITRAEAEQARAAVFDRADANGDGSISQSEREAIQGANANSGRMFDGADTNDDGAISRAEMMSRPYRAFDFLDRNHDNVLSAEEMQRVRARAGG